MTWFKEFALENFVELVPVRNLKVLQIGVWTGDATEWLLDNRTIDVIFDVDCWNGTPMPGIDYAEAERIYDQRFKGNNSVIKVKSLSDEFFVSNNESFDFIYIDGDHDPQQTYRDGVSAWSCLSNGGVLAFDDYEWEHNGVSPQAGIDLALTQMPGHKLLRKAYQLWVCKP